MAKFLRKKISIQGVVQGVGFRPFIYRSARACELTGFVTNTHTGVCVEVEGKINHLDEFIRCIRESPPVRSRITNVKIIDIPLMNDSEFTILQSAESLHRFTLISPDIATCDACIQELFDPSNRRYQYPFINCTDCGPRYTIIQDIPYDRPKTTMKPFIMCSKCQAEYDDPENRRFHAQPNACPQCGPRIRVTDCNGKEISASDPLQAAIDLLTQENVLAIKGLGGFHLVCDASADSAVRRLRERKHREEKPLAVMAKNTEMIRKFAEVGAIEEKLLLSHERPIVLLKKLKSCPLADSVAPGNHFIGVMLPYTPLHHLIMQGPFPALVMTSGNISDEPIAFENEEAFVRLKHIADFFLFHDRDIYIRNDDSVVHVVSQTTRFIRRSRGYAPMPVFVPDTEKVLLAVGGELKNTIGLLKHDRVFLSHHIGDLENAETLAAFELSVNHLKRILDARPEIIAHDLHPDYLSTQWACKQDLPIVPVQHHHAHIAACMAEQGVHEPVIGIALDGTGFGTDGHIWGGEVLLADFRSFERLAHFAYRPMPGSALAIKEPWRMAMAYLSMMQNPDKKDLDSWSDNLTDLQAFKRIRPEKRRAVATMIHERINSPLCSSLGRLFDAVSFLSGCCSYAAYEGQAAMMLEQAMEEGDGSNNSLYREAFRFDINETPIQICPDGLFRSVLEDLSSKIHVSEISLKFHNALVDLFVKISQIVSERTHVKTVALSGGCFQNRYLLSHLSMDLERVGFRVLTHSQVPCNDGGLALGQAMIGAYSSNQEKA